MRMLVLNDDKMENVLRNVCMKLNNVFEKCVHEVWMNYLLRNVCMYFEKCVHELYFEKCVHELYFEKCVHEVWMICLLRNVCMVKEYKP